MRQKQTGEHSLAGMSTVENSGQMAPLILKLYTCKNKCSKYSEHELSQDPFSNVKDDFTEAAGFTPATELGARRLGV